MLQIDTSTVPRDRWGRPVINGRTYIRASTIAKALDDQSALIKWAARQAALGLAVSPDLIAETSVTDPDNKKALDAIVERAQDRARSKAGASVGTAIHAVTELLDLGQSTRTIPHDVLADAQAYFEWRKASNLEPLAAECFVVNEALGVAGTFDRLLQGPHRVVVGDLKTSGNPDTAKWAALSWAVQIACYATAKPWTPERGVVEWADLGLPAPDTERGLVIHIVQGQAVLRAYSIDLTTGLEAAKIALQVYRLRKDTGIATAI